MRITFSCGLMLVSLLLCVLVAGCSRERSPGIKGAVLRYPMAVEPATMDPAVIFEGGTGDLLQNIYEGLVGFDENNRIRPVLAEKWEVGQDGKTYTFHLKAGVTFHNGRTLNAADVKYSLERALLPSTRSTSALNYLGEIVGAEEVANGKRKDLPGINVIDSDSVAITLKRPRGYFLGALAYATGFIVCREAIEQNSGVLDERAAVGTGPFKLLEYRRRAKVVLVRNDRYHGGKPLLERIERPIVLDSQTRHLMYENGEIDLTAISASDYLRDQKDPKLSRELHRFPLASVVYLCMHPKRVPAFRDIRVRQAFAQALDKDEIIRVASHGLWTRADGLLPPGLPGANAELPKSTYDVTSAKRLISEAGFGGARFPRLTLTYSQGVPERSAMAQVVRSSLQRNLGISVALQEREAATFVTDRRDEKMPFYIGVWDSDYLDPQNSLSTLLRTGAPLNDFGYSNPRFDALVDRADAESDQNARVKLYQEAERIAMEDVALLPVYFGNTRLIVKPNVKDLKINLMGYLPHYTTRVAP